MSRVKSTNEIASVQAGFDSQWIHIPVSNTGRVTITPRKNEQVTLLKVIVNTAGSTNPATITDSGTGVIASIGASSLGQLPYNLPCYFNSPLYIDNTGGADLTVIFKAR